MILDKLCHASLIDGSRLSGATLRTFSHNDLEKLEKILISINDKKGNDNRILIVTEGIFSMDGDSSPILEIIKLKKMVNIIGFASFIVMVLFAIADLLTSLLADKDLLMNATAGYPSVATLTQGTNMTITNTAGAITLAANLSTLCSLFSASSSYINSSSSSNCNIIWRIC